MIETLTNSHASQRKWRRERVKGERGKGGTMREKRSISRSLPGLQ